MKGQFVFLFLIFKSLMCFAQDKDSIAIDCEIKKNPAAFPIEYATIKKVSLSRLPKRFAGVRWIDFVGDTATIGCCKTINADFIRIVLKGGLGNAFTGAMRYKKAPAGSDSLFIYLLDFWLAENLPSLLGENSKETSRIGHITKAKFSTQDYGYITALVCTKDAYSQMRYHGKLDTMITLAYAVKGWYGAAAEDMAERALSVCLDLAEANGKPVSESALQLEINNAINLPQPGTLPDGLFLSFNDFKKGRVLRTPINLLPRVYAYAVEFNNKADMDMYSQGYWGLCFNGNFYIKRGNTVSVLHKIGKSFCTFAGSRPLEGVMVNTERIFNSVINEFRKGPTTYSPERTFFYPFMVNTINGKME